MKVAIAHSELGEWDGSSRYIADVAGLFAEHGHDVTLVCRSCTRNLPAGLVPRDPVQLAPDERFDLLYGSDLELLHLLAPRCDRFFYAPLDVLGSSPELERWALQRCDRLLRFTRGAVEILERTYDLELMAKSLVAVYVSREFERLPEPEFARPTPPVLLWVGRLIASKDVAFLVRAAALIETPSWRLDIVGDGPERPALEQQVQAAGLADRVRFLGHAAELSSHFAGARLFLTASRREHYSLTLMEAAAHGVPCLGRAPDGREVINACDAQIVRGKTGYLFREERELAGRIDELLRDEPKRMAMARCAWERKRDEFSVFRFWNAIEAAMAGE